jgi:Amidohydrolase
MDEASIPKIISVDDHVVEPAHVWVRWLPAKYRDRGPRVERIDRITFETDYPHTDSTWPHSRAIVAKLLDGLDAESTHKIVRGNAIDLFELQGFQ